MSLVTADASFSNFEVKSTEFSVIIESNCRSTSEPVDCWLSSFIKWGTKSPLACLNFNDDFERSLLEELLKSHLFEAPKLFKNDVNDNSGSHEWVWVPFKWLDGGEEGGLVDLWIGGVWRTERAPFDTSKTESRKLSPFILEDELSYMALSDAADGGRKCRIPELDAVESFKKDKLPKLSSLWNDNDMLSSSDAFFSGVVLHSTGSVVISSRLPASLFLIFPLFPQKRQM